MRALLVARKIQLFLLVCVLAACSRTSTTLAKPSTAPSVSPTTTGQSTDWVYATRFNGPPLAHFDPSVGRAGDVVRLILPAPTAYECGLLLGVSP